MFCLYQGNTSSQDEKATSALEATNLDNKQFNGNAVQIRVVQVNIFSLVVP